MCGITGFYSKDRQNELAGFLDEATRRLSHRGPDGHGVYIEPEAGVGLGHQRLSIIDLSRKAAQPMHTPDKSLCLVYNGEIYNFAEIRKELENCGHRFVSRSDSEVILYAYLQWGKKCLEKFVGMFAFALFDARDRTLFLARDRMGIKPLYYYLQKSTLVFGSELKALRAFPLDFSIDSPALGQFLHYQYVPAPRTIFSHVKKLLPGHHATFDGHTFSTACYWDKTHPGNAPTCDLTPDQQTDRLDELITRSVSQRLVSDVPLGALLSGGVDSSLIAAVLQKVNPGKVRTFSIGFEEKAFDESEWAQKIADHLQTDHTRFVVTPGNALDVVARLPQMYDEPFADSSAIPTHLVSVLAHDRVKVALSGDGADELFGGYVRYGASASLARMLLGFRPEIRKLVADCLSAVPPAWVEKAYLPLKPGLPQRFQVTNFYDKWKKVLALLPETQVREIYRMTVCLWTPEQLRALGNIPLATGNFEQAFARTKGLSVRSRFMYADQLTYLPDCMLTKVDRASMATGLEVRVPYLDHRIVEFAAHLPETARFGKSGGKVILKNVLARYVPPRLFERPKMGFGVPLAQWLRTDLRELMQDYLSYEHLQKEGRFDPKYVTTLIQEHMTRKNDHSYRLWALLVWEMWLQNSF